jgi:hypothetical protein
MDASEPSLKLAPPGAIDNIDAIPWVLRRRCDVVFDGGEIFAPPVGSTIIDLSVPGKFAILRQGINHEHYADLMASKWGLVEKSSGD